MITKYFDVCEGLWGVVICYDYDLLDFDDVRALCRSFGLSEWKAKEAIKVLSAPNTGMTLSRDDIRMSLVFISDATSVSEFLDSLAHELYHCCTAIIDYYGKSYESESAAYLYGDLLRDVVEKIAPKCKCGCGRRRLYRRGV